MRVITLELDDIQSAMTQGLEPWLQQQQAEIVCLQHLQSPAVKPILLPGYHYYAPNMGLAYDQVAIHCKELPKALMMGLSLGDPALDSLYIQVDFERISVVSLYIPRGSDLAKKQQFMQKLQTHLLRLLRKRRREFIICGGWGIAERTLDVSNSQACQDQEGFLPAERQWLQQLLDSTAYADAFREIIREPQHYTWRHNGQSWRVDYQLITPGLRYAVAQCSIATEQFSAHAPVIIDYMTNL